MKIRAEVSGEKEVAESLGRCGKAGTDAAKLVLKEFAERILSRARPLVPVDDEDGGQLRDSGRITRPTATARSVSAGIVFGGAALEATMEPRRYNVYAIIQHEDMGLRHNNGQAKFLEQPFFAEAPGVPAAIMAALDKLLANEGV